MEIYEGTLDEYTFTFYFYVIDLKKLISLLEIVQTTTAQSTTTNAANTRWKTTTHEPTTVIQEANKTKHEGLNDNVNGTSTGTVILIVIPLICFILIVVISIDIYCRFR